MSLYSVVLWIFSEFRTVAKALCSFCQIFHISFNFQFGRLHRLWIEHLLTFRDNGELKRQQRKISSFGWIYRSCKSGEEWCSDDYLYSNFHIPPNHTGSSQLPSGMTSILCILVEPHHQMLIWRACCVLLGCSRVILLRKGIYRPDLILHQDKKLTVSCSMLFVIPTKLKETTTLSFKETEPSDDAFTNRFCVACILWKMSGKNIGREG